MDLYTLAAQGIAQFNTLKTAVKSGKTPVLTVGLSDIHKTHFLYSLYKSLDIPILIVTPDEASARRISDDMNTMFGGDECLVYPARDFELRQSATASKEYEHIRIGVMSKLLSGECRVCACSFDALIQRTLPADELKKRTFTIDMSASVGKDELIKKLLGAGYVRFAQVEGVGQFSVRGGIIDIFPPDRQNPVRIELWGDDIDALSEFDIESQRRTDTLQSVRITPASECIFDSNEALCEKITALLKTAKSAKAKEVLQADIDRLKAGGELVSQDKYLPLAYDTKATLLDYFDCEKSLIAISEYVSIKERSKTVAWQYHEDIKLLLEQGELIKGLEGYQVELSEIMSKVQSFKCAYFDTFSRSSSDIKYKEIININPIQTSHFSGELKVLYEDLVPLLEGEYTVCIMAGTAKAGISLAEQLQNMGLDAQFAKKVDEFKKGRIYVLEGTMSSGFEYPDIHFSLMTVGQSAPTKKRKANFKKGKQIRSLDDLANGDIVVHVSYGIGIFDGIKTIDTHGIVKDYIKIKYAGADTLYVPVTQLDLVSKYIGTEDKVRLNRLNSGEWQKTKSRVKKACEDMADELIELYAKRMNTKGFSFSEDTAWQKEFEDGFSYEETDDQLRCVEEIKKDMESLAPMDRLLCGDVGFGKTEVALRAAFKCIMDSKQCAILCPTTILAWQHYNTALERFSRYPIRIELLSRFRTPKQQRETIRKLKTGEVDLVIGTHRLVQKDVEFKDLGLAIIDEEQRFGVTHKERFKQMFKTVDVLTLSATPIPRTLNMAMSGIRDMSTIEQPPEDRHPVQTYVLEHNDAVIADAIKKELRRGGQVYYIHNRVETIDLCAAKIMAMVPEARIGVAHGKMSEAQLSDVWKQLLDNEIDILVCTTIIETGVDVKNCNTLIIENADYMGLSQLYQLRGRIGRSSRRAFAYFTFTRGKVLSEVATKRLSAIREFTTFGSGFRIALRDLEIRGAGSILGSKQHGHMEAVGYDMYVRLLSEAISDKKGEAQSEKSYECVIDLPLNSYIPESYIENLSQRLDVYKKIACVKTPEEKLDLTDELIDRFGDVPPTVATLIEVSRIRNTLALFGFSEITQKGPTLILKMQSLTPDITNALMSAMRGRVMVNASSKPYISVRFNPKNEQLIDLLNGIAKILSENKTLKRS